MARLARVVIVDVAHHVTQRGNARQVILDHDADRIAYLELLRQYSELYHLSLLGYCLMSNHVHLIAVPRTADALAQALKHAHGRYACYWNGRSAATGHVWQGRFYSCPLDDSHLWEALRYVELNPVRAGLAATPDEWIWSSAAAHCRTGITDTLLEMHGWSQRWTPKEWSNYLSAGISPAQVAALRQCTHTGRPLGTPEFVTALEKSTLRPLAPRKAGRRSNQPVSDPAQHTLAFVA